MSSGHPKAQRATVVRARHEDASSDSTPRARLREMAAVDLTPLWQQIVDEGDPAARAALIEQFMPLAKAIAASAYGRRVGNGVEFDDYLHFAYLGLLEALERYDPGRGVQFMTFAAPRIRGAIFSGLERHSESMRRAATRRRLEHERTESLIPERLPERHEDVLAQLGELGVSIAMAFILDATGLGGDRADGGEHPYTRDEQRELHQQAWEMVARLGERERFIIEQHYRRDRPFAEIAVELGVSRARVSQLHRKAIGQLRLLISKGAGCDVAY